RLLDQRRLRAEERMLVELVRGHRAAERDEAADASQILRDGLAAREVEGAMMDAPLAERVAEQSQPLGLRVAHHQPGPSLPRRVRIRFPHCHRRFSFPKGARTVKAYREVTIAALVAAGWPFGQTPAGR